jgi:hypothetical protein
LPEVGLGVAVGSSSVRRRTFSLCGLGTTLWLNYEEDTKGKKKENGNQKVRVGEIAGSKEDRRCEAFATVCLDHRISSVM